MAAPRATGYPDNFQRRRVGLSRRPAVLTALAFALVGFLVASLLLARALSGAGAERGRILELLQAQASGEPEQVLALLPACSRERACVSLTSERVRGLRRPGEIEILAFEPSVRVTPTVHVGPARVAWRVGTGMPVVQCVQVRREGPLAGDRVELLSISAPIPPDSSCARA